MHNPNRPVFEKPHRDDFFLKLHHEVQETVLQDKSLHRLNIFKALALLAVYFGCYAGILVFGDNTYLLFGFYILTGASMMVLFINAYHDAAHGALFKKPKYNTAFMYVLELFGSNSWLWQKRHLQLHHPYPNVQNWDIDIRQGDIVRIFPNVPRLPLHKYQHIYMWFIYPLYSLNWLYIRDFRDFFGSGDNYVKRVAEIPKAEFVKLLAAKLFNLFYLIGVPLLLLSQPWTTVVLGWLAMHLSASMLGVVALISTHVDEHSHFPGVPEDGNMGTTWAAHQMLVTKDFSTGSRIANFLFGGFTHHVAHHLFPGVAHTYYPHITPIIRRYAAEYGLPYVNYPFHKAVLSHFRLLKSRGSNENILATGEI
jgi:linoleoyl-CoA desaturase